MFNPWQNVINWLSERLDAILAALNPINAIMAIAGYFASLLPEPDPRLLEIVNSAVSALDTVVKYISLADYVINLPVLLTVVGIILVAEAAFNIYRSWRIIRSAVT